jgi:hypothetical protein
MRNAIDRIGEKYGKLTVKRIVGMYKNRRAIVLCDCECGNVCDALLDHVVRGLATSCGCVRSATSVSHAKSLVVDGTRPCGLASEKMCKNNTSGVKGVSWESARGVWLASLAIRGRTFRNRFTNKEDAIMRRREWEVEYHLPVVEEYRKGRKTDAV